MQQSLRTSWRVLERSSILSTSRSSLSSSTLRSTPSIFSSISNNLTTTKSPLPRSTILSTLQIRHASHATQGRANAKARDPAGKRLGAKKSGEQYVVPGNIIFKQRGTLWFPGENCGMGRDHTIYATEAGYVKYYRDPELHPKRRYIGVCFEREGTLPTPRNAPTRRRLNMIAVPRVEPVVEQGDLNADAEGEGTKVFDVEGAAKTNTLPLRPGYMYREANWQIGRAGDEITATAESFDRNNRWLAWRKRQARAQRAAQMKSLKGKKKSGKKAKR
ncbi:hypothetical protein ZTR_07862 [Talaromyces verruculosus]|nr:hypothetical protein ZTR_07862 [Talaromyces verruculosus]